MITRISYKSYMTLYDYRGSYMTLYDYRDFCMTGIPGNFIPQLNQTIIKQIRDINIDRIRYSKDTNSSYIQSIIVPIALAKSCESF